jgi:hypothetical protein
MVFLKVDDAERRTCQNTILKAESAGRI